MLFGLVALIGLAAVTTGRLVRAAVIIAAWGLPLGFLVDLQYWLYNFGHNLQLEAPLYPGPFTPRVLGRTKVVNFHSECMVTWGWWALLAAGRGDAGARDFVGWMYFEGLGVKRSLEIAFGYFKAAAGESAQAGFNLVLIARNETIWADWLSYLLAQPEDERRRRAPRIGAFGFSSGSLRLETLQSGRYHLRFQVRSALIEATEGERVVYAARKNRREQDWLRLPVSGITLDDARASLELVTAIYHSAETGEQVTMPVGAGHARYESWLPAAYRKTV